MIQSPVLLGCPWKVWNEGSETWEIQRCSKGYPYEAFPMHGCFGYQGRKLGGMRIRNDHDITVHPGATYLSQAAPKRVGGEFGGLSPQAAC